MGGLPAPFIVTGGTFGARNRDRGSLGARYCNGGTLGMRNRDFGSLDALGMRSHDGGNLCLKESCRETIGAIHCNQGDFQRKES
jgi:hypothetical protein